MIKIELILHWEKSLYNIIISWKFGRAYICTILPNETFFLRIHCWAKGTIKVLREFWPVWQWTQNSKFSRTVNSGSDAKFQCFWSVFAAPCLSCTYPEKLRWCIFQTGQFWFRSISLNPFLIRQIWFLYSSIICNILSLRVNSIQLKTNFLFHYHVELAYFNSNLTTHEEKFCT